MQDLVANSEFVAALELLDKQPESILYFRRILRILGQWSIHHSFERAESIADRESGFDADSVAAGYNEVRTFVWAMPVLGFIGTVIGISIAVGQFSSFLGGRSAISKQ